MNADREHRMLTQAHQLADTTDLAEDITSILGSARATRIDPGALTGLAAAALALGADSIAVYRARGTPYPTDSDYTGDVEDADASITSRITATVRLHTDATAALAAARDALTAARAQARAAAALPVTDPCQGCHHTRAAAIATAQRSIAVATDRAVCAETAAAIAGQACGVLRRALTCLRHVLPDLDDTYEPVYDIRRRGHHMPKDGDFLTGDPS